MENYFILETIRFHLKQADTLVIRGWYPKENTKKGRLEACLDGRRLPLAASVESGVEIRQKYLAAGEDVNEEVRARIALPQDWREAKELEICCDANGQCVPVRRISVHKLKKLDASVDYYVESESAQGDSFAIAGWAMGREPVEISLKSAGGAVSDIKIETFYRRDVAAVYEEADESYQAGFRVKARARGSASLKLELRSGGRASVYKTSTERLKKGRAMTPGVLQKAFGYYQRNGLAATFKKIKKKMFREPEVTYHVWRKKRLPAPGELEEQRKAVFKRALKFSVAVPLYRTPERYLREMIRSVMEQTYSNWELCLCDGGGAESPLTPILEEYARSDGRIRFRTLDRNLGISGNTNAAVEMATGDFILFADHDDLIAPEALYEFARALEGNPQADMIYSDEDKVDMEGKTYFEPNFKPDLNIDLLCSVNYICHLTGVSRKLLKRAGGFRSEFDGAQDYDFILRCVERADFVYHIPKVLYHWRCHMDSTAASPESKLYAFEAGARALEEHYQRIGVPATVEHADYYGMYHSRYHWGEEPLVSVIIPNKDHIDDLEKCLNSIFQRSAYRNLEFIIVENNSVQEETFAYYKRLQASHENVRVVFYKGEFNFSKINNFGAEHARGEYLLLLNNDTEIINPECIGELLGYCMREDVGITGALLLYEDDKIQHAGVVIGFGGIAGHTFIGADRYDLGYQARIVCAQDYSAVTAACLMTKRSLFDEVGGLTQELAVAFNDIDYCMKIRALGKLVVYNPYAKLYHYESKSRGLEDTPQKVARFNREIAVFRERWPDILRDGDPYYNPNLSLDKSDFSLK